MADLLPSVKARAQGQSLCAANVSFCFMSLALKRRSVLLSELERIHFPSGDHAMRSTVPSWANFANSSELVPSTAEGLIFQIRTRLSTPPAATREPSGLQARP